MAHSERVPMIVYLPSHIVGNLKVSVSTGALSVDSSLGDSLASEMSELVEEVEVLGEDGAAGTSSHGVLVVVDGHARGRRNHFRLHSAVNLFLIF